MTTGASGGSTVNVVADSEPVNVTTNGAPTPDTVNIGAADGTGNLTGITGPVNLTGNQLYVLTINDQGDASVQTYAFAINNGANTGSLALGIAGPFLNFSPSNLTSLTFNGGSADGNAINFTGQTPDSVTTQINAGAGDDTTVLQGSGTGSTVNIDSQAGSNTVILGGTTLPFPGGAQQLLGVSVNVSDASGTTNLTIDDSENNFFATFPTLTGSSVTALAPATINFTAPSSAGGNGVNVLTVNGGSSFNNFIIDGTLANSVSPFETLNSGVGFDGTVTVQTTTATGPLTINGQSGFGFVSLGNAGVVSDILGPVTITNTVPAGTELTVDGSTDPNSHPDISLQGSAGSMSTLTGLTGNTVTYATNALEALTINTGPSGSQVLNVDFSAGNPLPISAFPGEGGLTFNAGAAVGSTAGSHTLNLSGDHCSSGPFASEIHNANSFFAPSPVGQHGSIAFVDSSSMATELNYSGILPINDTTPAVAYTFNDFATDPSFTASDGPAVLGFNTIQFANTPASPPPTFETTTVANKTNVTFTTMFSGTGIIGVVNIPVASTGLATLTFNTPNDGHQRPGRFLQHPASGRGHDGERRRGKRRDERHGQRCGGRHQPVLERRCWHQHAQLRRRRPECRPSRPVCCPVRCSISLPGFGSVDADQLRVHQHHQRRPAHDHSRRRTDDQQRRGVQPHRRRRRHVHRADPADRARAAGLPRRLLLDHDRLGRPVARPPGRHDHPGREQPERLLHYRHAYVGPG